MLPIEKIFSQMLLGCATISWGQDSSQAVNALYCASYTCIISNHLAMEAKWLKTKIIAFGKKEKNTSWG